MARLFAGEKDMRAEDVVRLLRAHQFGLSESEIADFLGWERRTTNNYLRDLSARGCVYKEGRVWYVEE